MHLYYSNQQTASKTTCVIPRTSFDILGLCKRLLLCLFWECTQCSTHQKLYGTKTTFLHLFSVHLFSLFRRLVPDDYLHLPSLSLLFSEVQRTRPTRQAWIFTTEILLPDFSRRITASSICYATKLETWVEKKNGRMGSSQLSCQGLFWAPHFFGFFGGAKDLFLTHYQTPPKFSVFSPSHLLTQTYFWLVFNVLYNIFILLNLPTVFNFRKNTQNVRKRNRYHLNGLHSPPAKYAKQQRSEQNMANVSVGG